jgi:hypothetical protein
MPVLEMQKKNHSAPHASLPPSSLQRLLFDRCARGLDREDRNIALSLSSEVEEFFKATVRRVPPAFGVTLLCTLLDGWTTSNSFGLGYRPCTFCGFAESDNCIHFATCRAFTDAHRSFSTVLGIPELHWLFLLPRGDDAMMLRVVGHVVAVHNYFNSCRTSSRFSQHLYRSFLDKALRDCGTIRHAYVCG